MRRSAGTTTGTARPSAAIAVDEQEVVDLTVVGEPSGLEVHVAQMGSCAWRVTACGRSAHSARPSLGVSAISFMARVIVALEEEGPFTFERDPLLGDPTSCVSLISGGTARNVVPEECSITLGLRLVRGQGWAEPEARLRRLLDDVAAASGLPVSTRIERIVALQALQTSPQTPLVQAVVGAARTRSGPPPALGGCTAGTDGGVLSPRLGVPMVVFGPGDYRQAHGPDEDVEVVQITEAAHAYVRIAERLLSPDRDAVR
jgi:succinyl-diaminopimelate desuccinylase